MRFQGEFETLKMIEQGGKVNCYSEYAQGDILMHLIQNKTPIDKNQLFHWMNQICNQISLYHRCYHRAYQYINPYTILICTDQTIKFLDLESQENEMVLIYLQKNIIRESFSRNGRIKKTKVYTDYYGLGRTMQFMLSQGNIIPQINIFESYSLAKIIKKCLEESYEKTYQNIKEIQKQLPKSKKSSKNSKSLS